MTVKAELQFVTDAGSVAAAAADNVARFRSELEKLQGLAGKGGSVGPDVSAFNALHSQTATIVALQVQGANQVAAIQAQAIASEAASQHRIAEQYQKDRNAIILSAAQVEHAQRGEESTHRLRMAELEAKGAQDAQKLRVKGEEDRARIAAKDEADRAKIAAKGEIDKAKITAKHAADMAKEERRAQSRHVAQKVSEETTSGLGGAAKAILEGKGIKGALGAFGGKGAKIAAIGEVALSIGRAAFDAAKQVAGISFEFGKAVVGAQAFKEDIYEAFKTVRGTTSAADATFQTAIKNADKLGITRAESIGQFLDLATKGFDDAKIKEIQGRLLDITTIDPRASIEGLTKVIGQVQATGRINQETLNSLSTFGLEQGDVIKQIGKAIGKSDAEVLRTLSSAGGLRDKRNIDFILNAIAGQTGGGEAGAKAAEKANRNLSSLIKRASEIPQNILFDIDVGPGLDNIKTILKSVLDYFSAGSATAERASKVIGGAFNALISGLTGTDMTTNAEAIGESLTFVIDFVEMSTPTIKAFGSAIRYVSAGVLALAGGIGWFLEVMSGDTSSIETFFSNIGIIIRSYSATLLSDAMSLGSDIVDGLVGGIKAKLAAVANIASSMGQTVISSVRGALDSHSPARELIKVGLDAGAGLAIGGERGTPMVASSFASMAMAGMMAAATVPPLPMTMPAGLLGASNALAPGYAPRQNMPPIQFTWAPVVQVNVGAGVDANDVADAIKQQLRSMAPELIVQFLNAIGGPK